MKTEDIAYRDGALNLNGFLAYDETVREKRPGVLVVHEGSGLSKHTKERAKMLAGLGYVAFAADMFGDPTVAKNPDKMYEIINDLRDNPPKLRVRAQAGLNILAAQPQVDAKRLGAIGFCFGGSTVLAMARGGFDLAGVVSFHGGLETNTPAQPGAVKASILVCHGADDPFVPPPHVVAFEEEMRKAGADWQVINYGGTLHGFTNVDADRSGMAALRYSKTVDQRSWTAMKAFFAEVFTR